MMNRIFSWRITALVCVSCVLISLIYLPTMGDRRVLAESDFSLKSDIISLRSRISRLEQDVIRLRNSNSNSRTSPPAKLELPKSAQPEPAPHNTIVNPPIVDGQPIGLSDPMYERLATLLIELKEDVRNLDRRLIEIEQQTTP